jgi:FKBP-type peptidyl-prolyl cis-trans isomerase
LSDEDLEDLKTYIEANPDIEEHPMLPVFQALSAFHVKQSKTATARRQTTEKQARARKADQSKADEADEADGSTNTAADGTSTLRVEPRQRSSSDAMSESSLAAVSYEGTLRVLLLPEISPFG